MNTNFETFTKKKYPDSFDRGKQKKADWLKSERYQRTVGFNCVHCANQVQSDSGLSGVQNRNHCPLCLWSRHVDLWQAGDRLCACKMPMQPIGLTFKKSRNRYGTSKGELMIIHQCQACQAFSINRIAADDDVQTLIVTMKSGLQLESHQKTKLELLGIEPILPADLHLVQKCLMGSACVPTF